MRTRWRRVLWAALIVNAAMFFVEMVAGATADSRALQADALDFLADAANYAVSLAVVGAALSWRARAALLKSLFMLGFAAWVFGSAILAFVNGTAPDPTTMGAVGALALAANVGVALLLYRYRTGDANMRSVWICSRNDAIGNVAVMLAAVGVFGTGNAWPDLIVASVMAALALTGSAQVLRQALGELRLVAE
ncbi:cation diffusion facilitator family transporter [Sphingobium subterraneum]|uniref:Cation diffusion facilitator family transporter n=2 Tax=Sphingobium subterraneum TaxID=627688 RepID=A0A841J7F8_9SPHN|nr:cation diffusion facilitator family transporter [Sphingobium subterraneum]